MSPIMLGVAPTSPGLCTDQRPRSRPSTRISIGDSTSGPTTVASFEAGLSAGALEYVRCDDRHRFSCLDHLANMILDHAIELRPPNRNGAEAPWNGILYGILMISSLSWMLDESRPLHMGNIMMPLSRVIKVEAKDVIF